MPKINILPKEVYQLIAAGEVVERPSSVIKEMIENSIDAGAKNITVEIKNGGTTYMRITDDGCGIERSEVQKVFIPHATSKIKDPNDLNAIGTLGFRGEAMASIGAVSRVELLTRTADDTVGTGYMVDSGVNSQPEDAGCPKGTTIVVRDIFYNTPARMKFLKTDTAEGNAVSAVVDRMAISHPEIAFRFIRDGKQGLVTAGKGDLRDTIYSVLGRELSNSLIPVDYSYSSMKLSGFVSKPSASRKSRQMQFFFINGRMVKSKTAMAALEQAYKNSIMAGRYPACVLNIEMNTSLVDVNVHPAKLEVRFANEKPVFELVYYGAKTAIQNGDTVKNAQLRDNSFDLNKNAHPTEFRTSSAVVKDKSFFIKKDEPIQTTLNERQSNDFWQVKSSKSNYNIDIDYDEEINQGNISSKNARADADKTEHIVQRSNDDEQNPAVQNQEPPDFRLIGQAFSTYIIIQIKNDLFIIDKHAAHERMNYESLRAQSKVSQQLLLTPETVSLTKEEFAVIADNIELLSKCGFEVEEFGGQSVIVRAVPSLTVGADIDDLICEIAQKLFEHKTDIEPDKMDWIFHSASCRNAVKAGDFTSNEEAVLFVKKLLSMPNIRYCPHGRPVMIKLSRYEIEKQFGRVT